MLIGRGAEVCIQVARNLRGKERNPSPLVISSSNFRVSRRRASKLTCTLHHIKLHSAWLMEVKTSLKELAEAIRKDLGKRKSFPGVTPEAKS